MSGCAEEVAQLEQLLQELLFLYRQGLPLTTHDVRYSMYMVKAGNLESLHLSLIHIWKRLIPW